MIFSHPVLTLALAATSAGVVSAQYSLVDTYDSTNFFREFDFFSAGDPTHGFVKYTDNTTANRDGLAGFVNNAIYMGVDYKNEYTNTTGGRPSVRLSSKKSYTKGLFIADIPHMPAGATTGCGLWPAYWMFGPSWPNSGEIDILEGVNTRQSNQVTLHTNAGCSMANTGSLSGSNLIAANCQSDTGCGQTTQATNNYGAGFNAGGGGVYAMEWTDSNINVWFFPRGDAMVKTLTSSNNATSPDPSTFGTPLAAFVGGQGCNIDQHFMNHNIVFDTTFCGDWAGKPEVWGADQTCSKLAASCSDYVGKNPQEFTDAYWIVNSVKVYQKAGAKARRVREFTA
ncbi:hypothetical protein GQ53DRAFT_673699 [Thozetella sp. PMI_491]|nr:hypothetical protein GQ53DRAFT_673699 [Thozetella sp. PMI_491]